MSQSAATAVVAAMAVATGEEAGEGRKAYNEATPATSASSPSAAEESSAPSHWESRYLMQAFIAVMSIFEYHDRGGHQDRICG